MIGFFVRTFLKESSDTSKNFRKIIIILSDILYTVIWSTALAKLLGATTPRAPQVKFGEEYYVSANIYTPIFMKFFGATEHELCSCHGAKRSSFF